MSEIKVWSGDIYVSIDSCPLRSVAVSLQQSTELWASHLAETRCFTCPSHLQISFLVTPLFVRTPAIVITLIVRFVS